MTIDTQMTLALLQELLMALRANDADGYKSWLALGIEELGRDVAGEVESDWMVPLLVEEERGRLIGLAAGHEPLAPVIAVVLYPCDQHHSHL